MTTTSDLRNVISAVDTGYITIKDKTLDTVVLQPYSVDLKTPYLNVTNYTVIPNGKDLNSANIQIALRCASSKLPNTGKVILVWIIGIVAVSGIVAHVRYKKLYIK